MFYYYGVLSLVGNELLPTKPTEIFMATTLVIVGAIVIGLTIGEFSAIITAITARDRAKNEELDIVNSVMFSLRLPENMQHRALEYYEELVKADFIKESNFYSHLSPHLSNVVKLFQIKKTMKELSFMNIENIREVESFASKCDINFYLGGDIILKQGGHNDRFYFVCQGLAEAITEYKDFIFFDSKVVEKFISQEVDHDALEAEKLEKMEQENQQVIGYIHIFRRKRMLKTLIRLI